MHHMYTGGKGDPLCPLGFHPQVRWPTRCKRCFRDYKEHGGKGKTPEPCLKKEELTRSTPILSTWNANSKNKEEGKTSLTSSDLVSSSRDSVFVNGSKLSSINSNFSSSKSLSSSASWTSTPDLENFGESVSTTVSVTLPRRRMTSDLSSSIDASSKPTEFTIKRRTFTTDLSQVNLQNSSNFDTKVSKISGNSNNKIKVSTSTNTTETFILKKPALKKKSTNGKPPGKLKETDVNDASKEDKINPDVEFILRVKSSKLEAEKKAKNVVRQSSSVLLPQKTSSSSSSSGPEDLIEEEEDDNISVTATDTTETTLVGKNESELLEELESLKNELEATKARCEKVEREKSDILLRRLASFETTSTKTTASEVLKLQQKVNELSSQSEDLKDDNKSLKLRVKELEKEIEDQKRSNSSLTKANELQAKLAAAETLCEELMDENEEMKKELRELEDEIEEMQDNFREDQADEYSSLKRELEQTTKNCRILSFKLKKSERRAEQLESEKFEAEIKYKEIKEQNEGNSSDKIKKLESDLKTANELSAKLSKELQEANKKLKTSENKSSLGVPPKLGTGEKISRASLTRGGSQEDPQQLMRDLQDSLEREADLREQLRFAEEEAANLRKKATRVEEDNDSLALQLKKMATKAKISRRSSPASTTRSPRPVIEKDEGISDEEDPSELRLLLDLNEQESSILRKKLEEQETDIEIHKKKIKELEEKLASVNNEKKFGKFGGASSGKSSILNKEIIKTGEEEEVAGLKKKLIEKEKEIERLENECKLSQKKSERGHLIKSQSLDSPTEQKSLDLKRQLEMVEQEATVLRTKIASLESENEKLTMENKKLQLRTSKKSSIHPVEVSDGKIFSLEKKLSDSEKQIQELKKKLEKHESSIECLSSPLGKTSEIEKLKKELKSKADELEKEVKKNENLQETLKRLRDDAAVDVIKFYKSRKPKKPTDLTTKLQLKKMVEDLENEIGDILIFLKKSHFEKNESTPELEEKNQKIRELEKKLNENKNFSSENSINAAILGKELEELKKEKKKLKEMLENLEQQKETWKSEKKNLEAQIEAGKKNLTLAQDELHVFKKKLEATTKELEEEKGNIKKLNDNKENMEKLEKEKSRLCQDVLDKDKQILEVEKKLLDAEDKLKKTEKNLSLSKSKVLKLEKKMEELEGTRNFNEKSYKKIEDELLEAKTLNSSLKTKISDLEKEIKNGKCTIKELEDTLRKERDKIADEFKKAGSIENKQITTLREDLFKKSKQLDEINKKFEIFEKEKQTVEENYRKAEVEYKKETNVWENKVSELETDLNMERKKSEKMKASYEKEQKNHELELLSLKSKIKSLEQTCGSSTKKMAEMKDEWTTKLKKLNEDLDLEKRKYDDLTTKYEILEEEHVVTKAQLVMEKEQAQNQVSLKKKEITALEVEIKTLQDSFSNKFETWKKEKKDLQEKLKGIPEKATKTFEAKWELEKAKLQAINEEQISLAEQLKQQNDSMVEQMDHMRKENEELRKKLDDFDKVSKIQRQMSADTNQLEIQLREARGKLAAEEKNHKSEMAGLKLRYDSRVNLITEELQTSMNNISRFKRERDMYKHMLEEAQTQISELKKSGIKRNSTSDVAEELKDSKTAIAGLEQQVSCMEDELSEARLECSKLKTELISEKSKWEVKVSELQSKINELEEEKILSSGRTKVVGLRTKMELAWQKEREDQQKLLQETSTLARDLRQTLYEVERERDKEKLESKRRQEQMKGAFEEEMEENRKKITELQYDLLELRDAHAKLRTTNEKLRREKDKWEKEIKMYQRTRIRTEEGDRKIQNLLENIDLLMKASFEQKNNGKFIDSLSKKKIGSKSKESSPMLGPPDEIQLILQRLNETAEELRTISQTEERNDDRNRRAASVGYRSLRSASTESDMGSESSVPRRPVHVHKKTSLHRKSLSLSETAGFKTQDQNIWRDDDNDGSLTSLEEHMSSRLKNLGLRENSMDFRLSGGSTQSDILLGDKKKKKSIFGKLKKLTKSKSIEDPTSSQEDILKGGGSDSEMSTGGNVRGSKKDLKEKLADMFKKDSSRSNSIEQLKKLENQKSKTLPQNYRGTISSTTSVEGRPLDKTKNPAASLLQKP